MTAGDGYSSYLLLLLDGLESRLQSHQLLAHGSYV